MDATPTTATVAAPRVLVARFVAEADDFIFDRWAITRTCAFCHAGIHWRQMQILIDDLMCLARRIRQPARHLVHDELRCFKAERTRHIVPWLDFRFRIVDAVAIDARRCASFKSHRLKAKLLQVFREFNRRLLVVRAA